MRSGYSARLMGALHISLLGAFRVTVGDAALVAGGAKQRAVLAMLALRVGDVVPESRLIDGVWGEATPNMVRNSLQVYVAHWRRVLGEAGCTETIERVGTGYRLVAEPSVVDAVRFETLRERARAAVAEERFLVAADRYSEALALWRGDALQDFVGMPFHAPESVVLEGARVQALAERMDALLLAGKGGEIVGELESLVVQHPYEERFRALLMHALYRAGRQVDALRAYEDARHALAEIGLEVGPPLRRMEERILQQDPTLDARHSPFTPVGAPEPISSLVGRADDVSLLVGWAARGEDRLVTLTGTGGVGKSRLALEVANRVQDEGWMPVAYVSVSESADRALLEVSINTAFGVPVSWRERPLADIARMLGQTPVLVVLDGVEHVLDAAGTVVRELLAVGRQVRVLATTRVPLGLVGERQYVVRPLRCRPEGRVAGQGVSGPAPAVELFVDRASRFSVGGEYDQRSLDLIAEICEEVDGLPLAIELAAARVGTLGVDGLRSRLGDRLDVVAAAHRAGEQRHRSLREVIRWSHELLGTDARRLLARLSAFSGEFSVGHAEGISGEPEVGAVLDAFDELARHSLLARVAGPPTGTPRFRLLRTVREFAREQLVGGGEAELVRGRLNDWVSQQVESTGGRMGVGARQFDAVEPEADNARGAVMWAIEVGDADSAARLCNTLYAWWMTSGRAEELARWCTQALEGEIVSGAQRAKLHLIAGRVHGRKDRVEKSNELLMSAMRQYEVLKDTDGVVHAASSLVENFIHRGDFEKARSAVDRMVELARASSDGEVTCRMLHARCWLEGSVGRLDEATSTGVELVRVSRSAGLTEFEAKTLADLAWIARLKEDGASALAWSVESCEAALRARTGGAVVSAFTERSLALLSLERPAEAFHSAVLALGYQSGDDLSPTSILRLALALTKASQTLGWHQASVRALDLACCTVVAHPAVTLWRADEAIVGQLFLQAVQQASQASDEIDESALHALARSLADWAKAEFAQENVDRLDPSDSTRRLVAE